MLARMIISFAYFLDSNIRYKKVKGFVYDLLDNPRSAMKSYFDVLVIGLVLLTVAIFIYDISHHLPYQFGLIEDFAVSVFIFEWIGRFWISANTRLLIIRYHEKMIELNKTPKLYKILKIIVKQKISYIFSPMAIIDLIAILPIYRPFRVLRIFLIFRLFKVFRYTKSLNSFFKVLSDKKFEFEFLFILGVFTVFLSSTIMYTFEGTGNNPHINSYMDAIYWAIITISTVGYGDITPVTFMGKVITTFLVGGGFVILVLATSIVTNALSEKMDILRENKLLSQARKLSRLIAIIGFGRMGQMLAEDLNKDHKNFIVVDIDKENILKARNLGYLHMQADASNYETINSLVFENNVEKVVVLTQSDAINLSILLTIKAQEKNLDVIVRSNSYNNIKKFKIAKADHIIFPYETVAEVAVQYIGNSVKFDAIDNILIQESEFTIDGIDILEGSSFIGSCIDDLGLDDLNITTIAILKNGNIRNFIFNPNHDEYEFEAGDTLIVVGKLEYISRISNEIRRQFA